MLGDTSLQFKRTRLRHCQPEPGTAGLSATKSIGEARADHSIIHCLPESLFASEAQRCVCGSVRHTGRIIQCRTRTVLVNGIIVEVDFLGRRGQYLCFRFPDFPGLEQMTVYMNTADSAAIGFK